MRHTIYCGQTECGKSAAAIHNSRAAWRQDRTRSVCYDINCDGPGYAARVWGPQALVFGEGRMDEFWYFVCHKVKHCLVFVEEATTSMPRDSALTTHFTRIRHRFHRLHILIHHATALLPPQRSAAGTLFLFNQHPDSAAHFAREWNDPRILTCADLPRFEFLKCRKFGDPVTKKHSVVHGIYPDPNPKV